jgi:hypothetical protein
MALFTVYCPVIDILKMTRALIFARKLSLIEVDVDLWRLTLVGSV